MDTFDGITGKNYEEKTEEVRPLMPTGLPVFAVTPVQNESNGLLKPTEPIRSRRSFCDNPELTISRRPSAIVSAMQQDQRRASSSGNLLLEYKFMSFH